MGVLANRCHAVYFVEYLWHREDTGDGLTWQLQRCRVAPRFSGEGQPAGLLARTLRLQELEDDMDRIGLSQFMLWANKEQTQAPPGFRWLTQYTEKLADRHSLPVTPVGLRPWGVQPLLTLGDASIIAHGHRSLVLKLTSDADYVVKIGRTLHIKHEVYILSLVAQSASTQGCYGVLWSS